MSIDKIYKVIPSIKKLERKISEDKNLCGIFHPKGTLVPFEYTLWLEVREKDKIVRYYSDENIGNKTKRATFFKLIPMSVVLGMCGALINAYDFRRIAKNGGKNIKFRVNILRENQKYWVGGFSVIINDKFYRFRSRNEVVDYTLDEIEKFYDLVDKINELDDKKKEKFYKTLINNYDVANKEIYFEDVYEKFFQAKIRERGVIRDIDNIFIYISSISYHENKIVDLVRYIINKSGGADNKGALRSLHKVIETMYLIDWKYVLVYNKQLTNIVWKCVLSGPETDIILNEITSDDRFKIEHINDNLLETTIYIKIVTDENFVEPDQDEKPIIDFVLYKQKTKGDVNFSKLVKSTYPMVTQKQGKDLNLVELSKDYIVFLSKENLGNKYLNYSID